MTLFDCAVGASGTVSRIDCEPATHRRLIDLGLLDCRYRVRARTKRAVLVDFGAASCVIRADVAANMQVRER